MIQKQEHVAVMKVLRETHGISVVQKEQNMMIMASVSVLMIIHTLLLTQTII